MKNILLLCSCCLFIPSIIWAEEPQRKEANELFKPDEGHGMLVIYRPEYYPPKNPPKIEVNADKKVFADFIESISFEKMLLKPGSYQLTSSTYKHIPKSITVDVKAGQVHYIRISHGTGWIDVWYDLLESDQAEFLQLMRR